MLSTEIEESLRVLRLEIERGEDIYEASVLIRRTAERLGNQQFLCGNPGWVEEFFESVPEGTESSLVFEWLRLSMMYADDGGVGFQSLARTWLNSTNPHKLFITQNLAEFEWI